jgi:hypothetical protein
MNSIKLIKNEYIININDKKYLENFDENRFLKNIENDILLKIEVENIIKNSISDLDYKLNWYKKTTHEKLWFLIYVLLPVNKAKNHKDFINVWAGSSYNKTIYNSLMLMTKRN